MIPVAKGACTHEALASRPKPAARRGHDVGPLQDVSKGVPGGLAGDGYPNVWCILASMHLEAELFKGRVQDARILLVEVDGLLHLLHALWLQQNQIKLARSTEQSRGHGHALLSASGSRVF